MLLQLQGGRDYEYLMMVFHDAQEQVTRSIVRSTYYYSAAKFLSRHCVLELSIGPPELSAIIQE